MRFYLIVLIVLFEMFVHGIPILETLTEDECKAYFVSNDIHLRAHAMLVCLRKWRFKAKRNESSIIKRSIPDNDDSQEEIDDFYIFW